MVRRQGPQVFHSNWGAVPFALPHASICPAPPRPRPHLKQIRFLESPEQRPPISELGWDPLLNMPSLEEFAAALGRQRRVIKGLLLDQVGWVDGRAGDVAR